MHYTTAHIPILDRVGFECSIQSHAEEVVRGAGTRTFPAANKTRGGARRGGGVGEIFVFLGLHT